MSNLAYARPTVRPSVEQHPRHIEIVATRAQRRARPRVAYAVVTVGSLFLIFAAQLLLSIVVSDGAYQITSLQDQQKQLLRAQQDLHERLDLLGSTQYLAANAAKAGMIPNQGPLAINLSNGVVYGLPGSADPTGCGGSCNLVANSLLAGVPLVGPVAPTAAGTSQSAGTSTPARQPAADSIPAPVTH